MPSARPAIGTGFHRLFTAVVVLGVAVEAAFAGTLDTPITASWSGIGLREWATRVSETAGLPVLVDRRLDPDLPIRLDCRAEPLLVVIARAAAAGGGEAVPLRRSVRIVPHGMADVVSRAEQARESRLSSLPPRQRAALARTGAWLWTAGVRPRDLLADLAAETNIAIEGIDRVPHDHLPPLSLPEMTLAERIDLLLAPFDLRVDWQDVAAESGSAGPAASGRIIALDAGLPPAAAPEAAAATAGATPAAGKPPRRTARERPKRQAKRTTFSLQVAAPLEELLTAIAEKMELTLDLDRESLVRRGVAPKEIVRLTVKDASRDELLEAILMPLDLAWTIHGDTLRVFAR